MSLFQPIQVGNLTLQHRLVLAPLTRFRGHDDHRPSDLAVEYYRQRATEPGTLLITEGTFIRPEAGGYKNVPGIWSPEQISQWKKIVDAVHAQGSYIYMQLWALGRAATSEVLQNEGGYSVVSSSDIPLSSKAISWSKDLPRALSLEEVKQYVEWYAQAARNFVQAAGGDGVELHAANGYLIDQFTQTTSNQRKDSYGGNLENRCRFARECVAAVSQAIGADKVGIRISPHSQFQDMYMKEEEMVNTFSFLARKLREDHPKLAYLHVTQPRVAGGFSANPQNGENIDFVHEAWGKDKPIILAGAYDPKTAEEESKERPNALIAFGRYWISNPDLPQKIRRHEDFTPYNRKTFYLYGPDKAEGYTTYKPSNGSSKL